MGRDGVRVGQHRDLSAFPLDLLRSTSSLLYLTHRPPSIMSIDLTPTLSVGICQRLKSGDKDEESL